MTIFARDAFNSTLPDTDSGRVFINGFFQYDKLQHATGSMLLALLAGAIFQPLPAACLVLSLGVVWEIKDVFFADGCSWRDIVADVAGIAVYLALTWRCWIWNVL